MSKSEFLWIFTRLIGCFFLWKLIGKVKSFCYSIYLADLYEEDIFEYALSWADIWPQLLAFTFYAVLSFYFLRRGRSFVSLLGYTSEEK